MAKSKKTKKVVIFTLIGLVIVGLSLAAVFRKREEVIQIQTEKVTRRNITEVVVANGRIQPVIQVKISPEVSGEIIALPVKEGQDVKKGDLLVKIKPDSYLASKRSAEASYQAALSSKNVSKANLSKAEIELKRNQGMLDNRLVSESTFLEYKTSFDVAKAQFESSIQQVEVARSSLTRADEDLAKTTIVAPMNGTVSKLNSQLGERVVGTAMMTGTEIMTVSDLNEMEARVDIGEIDVVLIAVGQNTKLEVDAFRDRKFSGKVSEIANSSKGSALATSSQSQEGTRFEVKIRIKEKEVFRPGMSVTADIETRSRTNVLAVPIQSVTTRLPKKAGDTNAVTMAIVKTNNTSAGASSSSAKADRKATESANKPIEVVFAVENDMAKLIPVKRGISDDEYVEITEGLTEGAEVVSGGYKAISRDLEDGKKIIRGETVPTPNLEKK